MSLTETIVLTPDSDDAMAAALMGGHIPAAELLAGHGVNVEAVSADARASSMNWVLAARDSVRGMREIMA